MAFATAQDYIDAARDLLQDAVAPYRFADAAMLDGLQIGLYEIQRLRPDAFFSAPPPTLAAVGNSITLETWMQPALVYLLAGHVHLHDDEPSNDTRGGAFLAKAAAVLTKPGG